jgi:DNA repair exonuclease SbcCD nuclease subunit
MPITFLHTADLQIGRSFASLPSETACALREARLAAIDRLASAARAAGAIHVVVAGDVFDAEFLAPQTVRQPLSRMRTHADITWHLLPGNHDPHRPGGLWERLLGGGEFPPNVLPQLSSIPVEMAAGVWLLPAPLTAKSTSLDPTAIMDRSPTPQGAVRIGLAHGSIRGFGGDGEAAVPIAPDRAHRAGLAYLALGDWHGTLRISDRAWYSGTPEPDRFAENGAGQALVVTIGGANSMPQVTPVETATYLWQTLDVWAEDASAIDRLEAQLRSANGALDRVLLKLNVTGSVSLADRAQIEQQLEKFSAGLRHMQMDISKLALRPQASDFANLGRFGVLSDIAQQLRDESAGDTAEAAVAADALRRLFSYTSALEPGSAA